MRLVLLVLILSCGLSALAATAPTPQSVLDNRDGVNQLKKNNPAGAQQDFVQALSVNPFEAKLHLNLGLTFEQLGQPEKAQASYETALKLAQDDVVKFAANYDLGEIAQKAKKTDEALKYYQEALKYNPESKETKVNIELLTKSDEGKGKGDNKDKDDKDQKKDQKDDGKDKKDDQGKNQDQQKDQPKDGKDKKQNYAPNKPQPQKFKSEALNQGDVNKILGEIKQQEKKIRAEFNKKEVKEQPRDKDW